MAVYCLAAMSLSSKQTLQSVLTIGIQVLGITAPARPVTCLVRQWLCSAHLTLKFDVSLLRSAAAVVHRDRVPLLWADQLHHWRADWLHGVLHPAGLCLQPVLHVLPTAPRCGPQTAPKVCQECQSYSLNSQVSKIYSWIMFTSKRILRLL